MNIKQLTDSIYLIPVLLDHFKKPTALTAAFLREYGIDEGKVQEFRKVQTLLSYHLYAVSNQWSPNYNLLREGLREYFNNYLHNIFRRIDLTDKIWDVLDYGCGSGQIGQQFKEDNPLSRVYYLDRENDSLLNNFIHVDFEKTPKWHDKYLMNFEGVIMSELLHCKNSAGQKYLINSAYKLLKPKGVFIIVENIDFAMAYRINKIKSTPVNVLTMNDLIKLCFGKFRLKRRANIFQHQIYVYEKI